MNMNQDHRTLLSRERMMFAENKNRAQHQLATRQICVQCTLKSASTPASTILALIPSINTQNPEAVG
ncbi:hypothetical protein CPC08DRAFT_708672 [Agrocybe pediades]|nr:hypothetical protein CPC08DRAFT_708672 [Agrocybe pediades]